MCFISTVCDIASAEMSKEENSASISLMGFMQGHHLTFFAISSQKLPLDCQANPSVHVNHHRSVKLSGVTFLHIFLLECVPNMKRKLLHNDA